MEQASTLKVQNERYRIMDEDQTQIIKTGAKEYVNKLVIPDATLSDGGTYICFVTNSGFDNLIYKSLRLTVQPSKYFLLHCYQFAKSYLAKSRNIFITNFIS